MCDVIRKLNELKDTYEEPLVDMGDTYSNGDEFALDYPEGIYFWATYDKEGKFQRYGSTENVNKTLKNLTMQPHERHFSIHEVIISGTREEKLKEIKDYKQKIKRILKQ